MRPATVALAAALTACAAPAPVAGRADVPMDVQTRLIGEGSTAALEVRVASPNDATYTLEVPTPSGGELGTATDREERAGGVRVLTRRLPISGAGSLVVEGVCATEDGHEPVCAPALYVDLGAPPDRADLVDIAEPAALWPFPPAALAAGLALAAALAAMALTAWRRRPAPDVPVAPPEAPHLAALRRWEAVRADTSLPPEAKALALSEIFRVYAEAALGFPASKWTTSETLAHLDALDHLPQGNVPRARRLLRATDLVKYAERRPGDDLFEELDADLRAFVDSTRPATWEGA